MLKVIPIYKKESKLKRSGYISISLLSKTSFYCCSLHSYGVRKMPNKLFESYLTSQKQFISVFCHEIKLDEKRPYETNSVEYFDLKIDNKIN